MLAMYAAELGSTAGVRDFPVDGIVGGEDGQRRALTRRGAGADADAANADADADAGAARARRGRGEGVAAQRLMRRLTPAA